MTFDWQNLVALTIVVAAAFYVARSAWRQLAARRPPRGCGVCSSCPAGTRDGATHVKLVLPEFSRDEK